MTHFAPPHLPRQSPTSQVSVVLPVKNGGVYLGEAVDSILNQTFAEFELIVVDDHSTDGAVEALSLEDSRITVHKNPGKGVIDAANHGASLARGRYLARMDSDDISTPDRLLKQVGYLESNPAIDIVGARVEIFCDEGEEVAEGYRLYEKWVNSIVAPEDIRRSIFIENPIPNPTMMIRRKTFEKLGGYRDMGWPEDYDFFLSAYERGIGMGKVNDVLHRWRDYPARTTRVDDRYSPKSFMKTRAHFLAQTVLKNRPAIIWGAGKNGPLLGRLLLKEGARLAGFIDINPRRIGKEKVGRPVIAPEGIKSLSDEAFIIVCVAARGAREEIKKFLTDAGKVEGIDYLFAL